PAPRPEAAVPLRAPGSAPLPPLRRPGADPVPADGSSSNRTIFAVVGGGLAVIAIAFLLITQVFGGDDGDDATRAGSGTTTTAAKTTSTSTAAKPATPAAQVVRGDYTVSVLNSTLRNGAAREAANKLESSGFKIGDVKQAITQTAPVTLIAFKNGSKRAALEVATLLGVSPANVAPATTDTLVAGSQANVVVTLGADKVQ
ncbi:MAG: LytR cell envelope-related transcriptional attenuator, partial [Solirubrobacterales bacterium]|nr:LytR cell envelope-related transcriptional attenuator [Solirubrobacterales bacterium]